MNLIHKDLPHSDRELFFGPLEDGEEFLEFETNQMPSLLALAGVFPSAKQASKNGWAGKEVAAGYSEVKVGKRRLYILNIF